MALLCSIGKSGRPSEGANKIHNQHTSKKRYQLSQLMSNVFVVWGMRMVKLHIRDPCC